MVLLVGNGADLVLKKETARDGRVVFGAAGPFCVASFPWLGTPHCRWTSGRLSPCWPAPAASIVRAVAMAGGLYHCNCPDVPNMKPGAETIIDYYNHGGSTIAQPRMRMSHLRMAVLK